MRRLGDDSLDSTRATDPIDQPSTSSESRPPREGEARRGAPRSLRARHIDPLWIMLGLGGLLVVVETSRAPGRVDEIVITADRLAASDTLLRRTMGRDPTSAELDASLQSWVDAEIAVREARRLGLDRDDPIVRRRLVQKMDQVLESTWDDRAPTTDEIDAWIGAHPDQYRTEASIDLTHVFVAALASEDPTGTPTPTRVLDIHDALAASLTTDPAGALVSLEDPGDAFVHGPRLRGQSRAAIVAKFGESFAEAIFADDDASRMQGSEELPRPMQRWQIIASTHGWHVVAIEAKRDAKEGARDVVAARAARDWLEAQRDAIRETERARLRGRYRVVREDGA